MNIKTFLERKAEYYLESNVDQPDAVFMAAEISDLRAALASQASKGAGVPKGHVLLSVSDIQSIDLAMQHMGDQLNSIDAADKEDEDICTPGFVAINNAMRAASQECSMCSGHGLIGGLMPGDGGYYSEDCPNCEGRGFVHGEVEYHGDGYLQPPDPQMQSKCEVCDGSRKVDPDDCIMPAQAQPERQNLSHRNHVGSGLRLAEAIAKEQIAAQAQPVEAETHNFQVCQRFDNWLISQGLLLTTHTEEADGPMAPALNWIASVEAIRAQPVADPMDWPLPCDVTVGNGTHKKGVPLRSLVARMNVLHGMAKSQPVADAAPVEAKPVPYEDDDDGELCGVARAEKYIAIGWNDCVAAIALAAKPAE